MKQMKGGRRVFSAVLPMFVMVFFVVDAFLHPERRVMSLVFGLLAGAVLALRLRSWR